MLEQPASDALSSVTAVDRERDFRGLSALVCANVPAAANHDLLRPRADRGHQRDLALEVDFDEPFQLGFGELLLRGEEAQIDRFRRKPAVSLAHAVVIVGPHGADHDGRAVAKALIGAEAARIRSFDPKAPGSSPAGSRASKPGSTGTASDRKSRTGSRRDRASPPCSRACPRGATPW